MLLTAMILCLFLTLTMVGILALRALDKGAVNQIERIRRTTANELADAFIFMDYRRLAMYNIAAFAIVPIITWVVIGNVPATLASCVVPAVAPRLIVSRVRAKRLARFREQFPDALISLASSLRAGASLSVALEALMRETKPPLSQEFGLLLRSQRLGVSFDDAVANMEQRIPLQEFKLFAAGLRIAREVGGNLADMLDSLAETLFKTMETEGKIAALTSQGKMQGYVMSALPIFMILVLNWMQPDEMAPLFNEPIGWAVLGVISVMIVLGYLGISAVTNIKV